MGVSVGVGDRSGVLVGVFVGVIVFVGVGVGVVQTKKPVSPDKHCSQLLYSYPSENSIKVFVFVVVYRI